MQSLATTSTPAGAHGVPTGGQYLIFTLGKEQFAVDILHIKEIIEFSALTEVPMMPGFVRGIINLRGAVVPVIDLMTRFGRGQTAITPRTCVVIVETGGDDNAVIGVMVDAVCEVIDIDGADIEPPPSFGARIRPDFIRGMGKINNAFVIMLQLDTVLSVDDMSRLAASHAGEPVKE
ncbi:MAG: chemotaxis protein CheW [Rhodocyclaceae bacterium]